jgi:hypothetical protein
MRALRDASAEVAVRARQVRIDAAAIYAYARRLEREETLRSITATTSPVLLAGEAREQAAARVLTLDAINFGSGWFPTLNKRPGLSGYRTIAAGLDERFQAQAAWTADELATLTTPELAATLGQDPGHPLIRLFVASLRDLGSHVDEAKGFAAVIADTAVETVGTLATWECFHDTSPYDELRLPFLKRAQIAAADLHRAGVANFAQDLHELTIFADNLVPHVLTLDGVLELDDTLIRRIADEQLIEHDSREEVTPRSY